MSVMASAGAAACLLLLVSVARQCAAEGRYHVVASTRFTPGSDYPVVVDISEAVSSDVTVMAEFSVNNTWRGEVRLITSQTAAISPGQVHTLTLAIPAPLDYNSYTLRVTLSGGIEAVNVTSIGRSYKQSDTAIVQLDKSVYKPGDTVHLRVIAVDPDLKGYVGKVTVTIKDPKGNVLRLWADVETDIGVVIRDMPLSDQPPLGSYSIDAKFDESTVSAHKTFKVEEYVLPKWSIDLDLPSYLERSKKPTLRGSLTGKYTYGEDVKGSATIIVRRPTYNNYRCSCENQDTERNILRKQTVTLNGKTDFSIDFVLGDRYTYSVEVFVAVTEEVTGEVRNLTDSVSIIDDPFNVNIEAPGQFKGGLPFSFTVKVSRYGDDPLAEFDSKEVIVGYYYQVPEPVLEPTDVEEEEGPGGLSARSRSFIPRPRPPINNEEVEFIKQSYILPSSGSLTLVLYPPEDAEQTRLVVYYGGRQRTTRYINKYIALNKVFVQVEQVSESLNSGEEATFRLNSSMPIPGFTYAITADKAGLVLTNYVTAITEQQIIEFNVPITSEMAPDAKLIVYFEKQGEMIADAIRLSIDGAFQNHVSLSFNGTREEPGSAIRLTVQAAPDSFVGINAIDASVKLLGDDHDIRQDQFVPSQGGYYYGDYNNHAEAEFRHAYIVMLTDAVIFNGRVETSNNPCIGYGGGASYQSVARGFSQESADSDTRLYSAPAGPPAASAGSNAKVGGNSGPVARVRKLFPETWLFVDSTSNSEGIVNIDSTVPDTITSYVANAFSVSKDKGIGIADQTANLEVFRPFFISLNLPYSVIRGEDVEVKVLVFNYMDQDKQVVVTLERSEEFQAIFSSQEIKSDDLRKRVNVEASGAESVSFLIRPSKVGFVQLKVRGQTDGAADALVKELLVKPEGIAVHQNDAIFIDVSEGDVWEQDVSIRFKQDMVPDSERVEVSVTGDIMGPSIQGLGNMLRIPHGCGEQNMVNFAPNIFIAKYLETTEQLNDELLEKAKNYMQTGYVKELTYQRADGSFSAFGDNDEQGSVWLTAFVVKSFVEAKEYIFIDQAVIDRALPWLVSKHRDGQFMEVGRIISHSIQGGSGQGVALTAYTLVALLEAQRNLASNEAPANPPAETAGDGLQEAPVFLGFQAEPLPRAEIISIERQPPVITKTIELSLTYLEEQLESLATNGNGYDVAIVTYALHMARSDLADRAYELLLEKAVRDDQDLMHWRGEEDEFESQPIVIYDSWLRTTHSTPRIRPVDIEATSYALLTMAYKRDVETGFPALRWLSRQRNSLGGFQSTQDTVVGLQALTEFAALVYDPDTNLELTLTSPQGLDQPDFTHSFSVQRENSIVLQSVVLPLPSPDATGEYVLPIAFQVDGQGSALLQVSTTYHIPGEADSGRHAFSIEVDSEEGSGGVLKLEVCARYLLPGKSNMAVMEVNVASGFTVDMEVARALADRDVNVQRVEAAEGNTRVNLYFNSLDQEEVCVSLQAQKDFEVHNQKPAVIKLYDYYDTSKTRSVSYGIESEQPGPATFSQLTDNNIRGFFTG